MSLFSSVTSALTLAASGTITIKAWASVTPPPSVSRANCCTVLATGRDGSEQQGPAIPYSFGTTAS